MYPWNTFELISNIRRTQSLHFPVNINLINLPKSNQYFAFCVSPVYVFFYFSVELHFPILIDDSLRLSKRNHTNLIISRIAYQCKVFSVPLTLQTNNRPSAQERLFGPPKESPNDETATYTGRPTSMIIQPSQSPGSLDRHRQANPVRTPKGLGFAVAVDE